MSSCGPFATPQSIVVQSVQNQFASVHSPGWGHLQQRSPRPGWNAVGLQMHYRQIQAALSASCIAVCPILADAKRYASNRGTLHFNNNFSDFYVTPMTASNVECGRFAHKIEIDRSKAPGGRLRRRRHHPGAVGAVLGREGEGFGRQRRRGGCRESPPRRRIRMRRRPPPRRR